MRKSGLSIAPHKSEAILLTRSIRIVVPRIAIDGHVITFKRSVRYLGVELDGRLTSANHVQRVVGSAAAIGRLMPNIGGPGTAKRLLLAFVVHSRLLYAAPV